MDEGIEGSSPKHRIPKSPRQEFRTTARSNQNDLQQNVSCRRSGDKNMTQRYIPEETMVRELAGVLFPQHQNKKAARTAVEFFLDSYHKEKDPNIDINTLRRFIDFMVTRGYS